MQKLVFDHAGQLPLRFGNQRPRVLVFLENVLKLIFILLVMCWEGLADVLELALVDQHFHVFAGALFKATDLCFCVADQQTVRVLQRANVIFLP